MVGLASLCVVTRRAEDRVYERAGPGCTIRLPLLALTPESAVRSQPGLSWGTRNLT